MEPTSKSNTIEKSWKLILAVTIANVIASIVILVVGNTEVFKMINSGISFSFLDPAIALIANFGAIILLAFAILLFILHSSTGSKTALFITLSGFWISLFVGYSLKTYFCVLRPYEQLPSTRLLVYTAPQLGNAFPSSHSLIAFFVWTIIAVKAKKYNYPVLALAAVMSFSRVYVGVHFPLDITVGALVGISIGSGLLLLEYLLKYYKEKILNLRKKNSSSVVD